MRTEPRRQERAMKDREEMHALLERTPVGRLGLSTEDGPYVVPVNYLFFEGCIFFHSATAGRKMEALRADPRVCFLADAVGPQVISDCRCGISQLYESVMCFGRAEEVEGVEEKRRVLERMVRKFVPASEQTSLSEANIRATAVVRIRIEEMSGKANRLSPSYRVLENPFSHPLSAAISAE